MKKRANEKWMVAAKKAPFDEIAEKFQIDPVIARLIRNRDVEGDDAIRAYLECRLEDIPDPLLLLGAEEAARLLLEKIEKGLPIRVIGDYDIDGICATYILVRSLKRLGAVVDYAVPERVRDGYGLNMRLVEEAFAEGVDTIITCDNGISAYEQIRYARKMGLSVIVTDHHEVPYDVQDGQIRYLLPSANVLVDPKQSAETYPFREMCGALVAWKVILCLLRHMGRSAEEGLSLLPYAAFATVGDVMDLKAENRTIVRRGLEALEKTEDVGMRALIRACGLEGKKLTAYHIGFVLGPCINASGRLETAGKALELLFCSDPLRAAALAGELAALNEKRKDLTELGVLQAKALLEGGRSGDKVYVIYLPECHESIAGIIAGRIREYTAHPVYVLTDSGEESVLKGSGRSIPAYSMFDELQACKDLLMKFGGHPMAAGVSLRRENLEALKSMLNENCTLQETDFGEKVVIDAAMPLDYISLPLIRQLSLLEPFGKGNEKPVFAQKNLRVLSGRIVGKNRNALKLRVAGDGQRAMDAMYFGDIEEWMDYVQEKYSREDLRAVLSGRENRIRLSVTYYPEINAYRGMEEVQIVITRYF